MNELRDTSCDSKIFVGVDLALVGIDVLISVFAFYQVCSLPHFELVLGDKNTHCNIYARHKWECIMYMSVFWANELGPWIVVCMVFIALVHSIVW